MTNARKITEAIQKAKFQGKSAADAIKELQAKETAEKKDVPADVPNVPKPNLVNKASSFAKSMASRGLKNNRASERTIALRVLSCHGNNELPPCPYRKDSEKFKGSYYCGACGCGDKQITQLTYIEVKGKMTDYNKLDYPKVTCPLKMPGFTDYKTSQEDPPTSNSRKQFIEFREGIDYIKENI